MTSQKNAILVLDFDHTIINCNSDREVRALAQKPIPEEVVALSKITNGWTQYMQALFTFLHQEGVTQNDYKKLLKSLPLVEGMKQLMTSASSEGTKVIVISDANSFFIDTILNHHGIKVEKVLTNPAEFDNDGCLMIKGYHTCPGQNFCSLCPPNLCKGDAFKRLKESVGSFNKTFFVGDGSGDVCLSLQLEHTDHVFARQGYSLLKKLENQHAKHLKAQLTPWTTAHDILNKLCK